MFLLSVDRSGKGCKCHVHFPVDSGHQYLMTWLCICGVLQIQIKFSELRELGDSLGQRNEIALSIDVRLKNSKDTSSNAVTTDDVFQCHEKYIIPSYKNCLYKTGRLIINYLKLEVIIY